jgi:hypothetical protein
VDAYPLVLLALLALVYLCGAVIAAIVAYTGLGQGPDASLINAILNRLKLKGFARSIAAWGLVVLWPLYLALGIVVGVIILLIYLPGDIRSFHKRGSSG